MSDWMAGFVFGVVVVLGPSFGAFFLMVARANRNRRLFEAAEDLLENPPGGDEP
jgi:hypothetical protein